MDHVNLCCFTVDEVKDQLDDYIKKLGIVKVIRLQQREGLIRARLTGAAAAKAEVLTFLDAHCECTVGWLEPLLTRIAENKSNVVMPVIDAIGDKDFRYNGVSDPLQRGIFRWRLEFGWKPIPQYEMSRRKDETDGIRYNITRNTMNRRKTHLFFGLFLLCTSILPICYTHFYCPCYLHLNCNKLST